MRVLCKDIAGSNGQEVEVKGWIHRIRDLGGVCFIMLRDRSGMVQLVLNQLPT